MMFLVALLLAFIAGVAMAVQGALNTGLGKIIGLLESTFVVHVIGLRYWSCSFSCVWAAVNKQNH